MSEEPAEGAIKGPESVERAVMFPTNVATATGAVKSSIVRAGSFNQA
jgi:hypothetical protein